MSESPQKENGYTPICNEVMDALARYRIPGEQRQCLDFIIRKTYGFNKKSDRITNSQFCAATGLQKGNVSRAIKALSEKQLIIRSDNTFPPTYEFNKHYSQWVELSKKQPVIKKATKVIKSDNKPLSKVINTKDSKDTLQKTKEKTDVFIVFEYWKNKTGHQKAKLDDKRKRLINARLKDGYSSEDLRAAVDGCLASSFHQGKNDSGTVHDGVELIFRNADKVDFFMGIKKTATSNSVVSAPAAKIPTCKGCIITECDPGKKAKGRGCSSWTDE